MIRGLDQAAKSLGIALEPKVVKPQASKQTSSEEQVPMMYRAQVDGRCSLMFAGSNDDLERWKDEWVYPNSEQPRYQKQEPSLGLDGTMYRIAVKFPFRLLSNCGQDSIIRPVLGKDGIPYLPGSSVKGLFRRACNEVQTRRYCGDDENLAPNSLGFRFHGAYPVGDWAGTHKVTITKQGKPETEVRYRMLDVVHPQQKRQVGSEEQSATALASISLYQPTLIFEFSSADPDTNWQEVETIFWKAIALGVGGKTSTGYGLGGHNDRHPISIPSSKASVALMGRGVSPTLRNDEPEFRPNLFKASLQGHFRRLLAGVVGDRDQLDKEVDRLFGSSSSPGAIQIFWQPTQEIQYGKFGATPTFQANGILHLDALRDKDVGLIEQVLKFALIMGGLGKSWRRASHQVFHKTYKKFEIGCHWESSSTDQSWLDIQSPDQLKSFLTNIHQNYIDQFTEGNASSLDWREAWHPDRLSVYAAVTRESKAISLFHDDTFKETPAIGGRNPDDKHPKFTSSVWHRMLPVGEGGFLEIITIFHAQQKDWKHQTEGEQLNRFIQSLNDRGLSLVWGTSNPATKVHKKIIPNKVLKKRK